MTLKKIAVRNIAVPQNSGATRSFQASTYNSIVDRIMTKRLLRRQGSAKWTMSFTTVYSRHKSKATFSLVEKERKRILGVCVCVRHGMFYIVNKAKHVLGLMRAIKFIFGSINPCVRDGKCHLVQCERYSVRKNF